MDAAGRERRVDFAIQSPQRLRLALEVDGYEQQRGTGMTKAEFEDFLSRQSALVNHVAAVLLVTPWYLAAKATWSDGSPEAPSAPARGSSYEQSCLE